MTVETNLAVIAAAATAKGDEQYAFREFLKNRDSAETDRLVYRLNEAIAAQIDCTQCGNCCKSLMISISPAERPFFGSHFALPQPAAEALYLSRSMEGNTIMSQSPCVFLSDNKCTVYEQRFTDCREFPHLHQPGFTQRMFSMIMHYGTCPIIYNVLEALKTELGFAREE